MAVVVNQKLVSPHAVGGSGSGEGKIYTKNEIKTLYESNADTNVFTDDDELKLHGIQDKARLTFEVWNINLVIEQYQPILYENSLYFATEGHTAGASFDATKFRKTSYQPIGKLIAYSVDTFAELPTPSADTEGKYAWVETGTGSWLLGNKKSPGLYFCEQSTWNPAKDGSVLVGVTEFFDDLASTSEWNKRGISAQAVKTALEKKIDKAEGKSLSTNDLTATLKTHYDTAYTHSQATHAPTDAEKNVQSDFNETNSTSDSFIKNKPNLDLKVDKVTGKSLTSNDLTDTLKSNYDTAYIHSQASHAPTDAEKNVQSDWNKTVTTADDYIKNKPSIYTQAEVDTKLQAKASIDLLKGHYNLSTETFFLHVWENYGSGYSNAYTHMKNNTVSKLLPFDSTNTESSIGSDLQDYYIGCICLEGIALKTGDLYARIAGDDGHALYISKNNSTLQKKIERNAYNSTFSGWEYCVTVQPYDTVNILCFYVEQSGGDWVKLQIRLGWAGASSFIQPSQKDNFIWNNMDFAKAKSLM